MGRSRINSITCGMGRSTRIARVRKGNSAEVMAALRNGTIHLLSGGDAVSNRAATHRFQVHPEEAIDLLGSTQCEK
jgi:hypothetical protein